MKKTFISVALLLGLITPGVAQLSKVNFPTGMIAYSADGNHHDEDDWGANALNIAMIHYAGLEDRIVHYDFNDHLVSSKEDSWKTKNAIAIRGGMDRFWGDKAEAGKKVTFNCLTELDAAIAHFVEVAKKASAENPLWYICAGPMEMPWRCLEAVKNQAPEQLKYIHWVSHSAWNNGHGTSYGTTLPTGPCSQCTHGDKELRKDYPDVTFHDIPDQNKSNGEFDFRDESDGTRWQWLTSSKNSNANWVWLYNEDEKANEFDVSDSGMMWWVITGGDNGGQTDGGTREMKALFGAVDADPLESDDPKIYPGLSETHDGKYTTGDGYVVMEAESTKSDFGMWQLIGENDVNYVQKASGCQHLEFTGNNPESGPATSPLRYTFQVPNDGTYQLMVRARKRLDGAAGDKCNDAYLHIEGGAVSASESANGSMSDAEIATDCKIYNAEADKWGWSFQYVKGGAELIIPIRYTLKKGVDYTIVISGRAQRYNMDYIVLYDRAKYNEAMGRLIGPGGINVPDGPAIEVGNNIADPDYFGFEGALNTGTAQKDGGWWNNDMDKTNGNLKPSTKWVFTKRAGDPICASGTSCLRYSNTEVGKAQIQSDPSNKGAGINLKPGTFTLKAKVYVPSGNEVPDDVVLGTFNNLETGAAQNNANQIILKLSEITEFDKWVEVATDFNVGADISAMKVGLNYNGKATTFYLDDLAVIVKSLDETTAVKTPNVKDIRIFATNRVLYVQGNDVSNVQVVDTTGRVVANQTLTKGAEFSKEMQPGLYIVKTGKTVTKIAIR